MARSLALPSGFPTRYSRAASPFSARRAFRRLADWLSKSQQRGVDREIETYIADRGFDHFTDSIERDIEYRFLARQRADF
jgi:hypothetical protein